MTVRAQPAAIAALLAVATLPFWSAAAQQPHRYLYVGVPGSDTDFTDRVASGILVFDIEDGHKFVRRISLDKPLDSARGKVVARDERVRGIAADISTRRLYVSTVERISAIDLLTDRVIWENSYGGQCCDRLDVSPDGATIYAPALGKAAWYVIRAAEGSLITTIDVMGYPRQTIFSNDGRHAFLGAWESRVISVADTATHKIVREVGPFSDFVCPFTINGRETLAFANVDGLVGVEVGDLKTGLILDRVSVEGSDAEAAAKYECPSHGIALTPDERELWLADGVDNRLHVFDAASYPPVPARRIELRAQPRWITFSIDGRYAYPSTGDVIDTVSGKIVAALEDDHGVVVRSEKMLEVDFAGKSPIRATDQVAIGGKR